MMKHTFHTILSVLLLPTLCLAQPLSLKEPITEKELGLDDPKAALESVRTAIAVAHTSRDLLQYPISDRGPNRIAVDGERILQAIYDQTQLEIQTDETLGQIFVVARSHEPQALFLTTDKKQTYSLTLLPQSTVSQEIVLKSRTLSASENEKSSGALKISRKLSSLPIETADSFPALLKNLMTAIARNELPEGFTVTNRCAENCLRRYDSEHYEAQVLRLQNKGLKPLYLTEKQFYEKGVLAVAIAQPNLRVGETTAVYVIKRKPQ